MTDHKGHRVITTETGRISLVAGDVSDTRKEVLFCTDCMKVVKEVPKTAQAVESIEDLKDLPF
jgi:hypothetical protein